MKISFGNVAPSMKRIWKYNGTSSQTRETTPVWYIYITYSEVSTPSILTPAQITPILTPVKKLLVPIPQTKPPILQTAVTVPQIIAPVR